MATAAPEIPAVTRARSFELLYRRHAQDVYRYALALLRNPADAEDVTQTTFMNAYRAYMRGEEPLKPQNWLIKIAHNAARTRYARATRRVKEVPLDDHVAQLAVPEEDKPDIREVLDALARLPLNQRAALVMRELEGRTYTEIADTLGVSVPAVETLIFRARRSLRLKASAIRSLAVVPLPSSLSQLFDAGGIVAGGGAVIGSGFLLKAAVAVVAGVVATGVSGDHVHKAASATRAAIEPFSRGANEQSLRPGVAGGVRAAGLAVARRGNAKAEGLVATGHPAARSRGADWSPGSSSSAATTESAGSTGSSGSSSSAAATTGAVTDTVGSATSALPTAPAPSLPVQVPPLPQPPSVPLPPPPQPPPLPTLP